MDVLNKEMKGASVGFNQFLAIDDGAKAKLNYQTLLNEYLDLQKVIAHSSLSSLIY